MKRFYLFELCVLACSAAVLVGCASGTASVPKTIGNETDDIDRISRALDEPPTEVYPAAMSAAPITAKTVQDLESYEYRNMSLTDVMRRALDHSEVLRELGGTVLRNPDSIRTQYASRLQNSDPRFGREAVLSEFDAQLRASAVFNNNDRIFNNSFFAGGATGFKQDLHDYQVELSKRTATGSQLSLRSVFNHDANNAPANTFSSAWNAYYEGEFRQPLLQGGGLEFNRIAGPNSAPGVYNGILIARANADITETEFEVAVRDFISNVENAYWDLYFAYRDVDARRKAMLKALDVWNRRKARKSESDPAELALAREQYYRFKADLDEAVAGRLVQGTQARNGSTGGTLRGTGGLLVAERKLRLLVGLPTGDGTLLRPGEEPTTAEVMFDWDSIRTESLNQRAELRQQQTRVRRREMELLAAKNYLNPRLDVFGRYRFRGFGDDLINDNGPSGGAAPSSAIGNLVTGNLQGWTAGVEVSVPVGYRRAHAAVSNAELQLARERAIHQEQQREIVHDLGNAMADVARAHQATRNNLNRYLAAEQALNALVTSDEKVGRVEVDRILDAQRRAVEAEIRYFRSRAEYAVSLKNVHFEKGSLLEFNNIRMSGTQSESAPIATPPVPEAAPAPPEAETAMTLDLSDFEEPDFSDPAPAPKPKTVISPKPSTIAAAKSESSSTARSKSPVTNAPKSISGPKIRTATSTKPKTVATVKPKTASPRVSEPKSTPKATPTKTVSSKRLVPAKAKSGRESAAFPAQTSRTRTRPAIRPATQTRTLSTTTPKSPAPPTRSTRSAAAQTKVQAKVPTAQASHKDRSTSLKAVRVPRKPVGTATIKPQTLTRKAVGSVRKSDTTQRSAVRSGASASREGVARTSVAVKRTAPASTTRVGTARTGNAGRATTRQPVGKSNTRTATQRSVRSAESDVEGSYRLGTKPKKSDFESVFGVPREPMGSARLGKRESAAFGIR